jgi:hypothetical protein
MPNTPKDFKLAYTYFLFYSFFIKKVVYLIDYISSKRSFDIGKVKSKVTHNKTFYTEQNLTHFLKSKILFSYNLF